MASEALEADFTEGYLDGRDPTTPEPSANRSACYRHSWNVGRAEIEGRPIAASISLRRAEIAIAEETAR